MPSISNFPPSLSDEHHAWHVPGSHPQYPTRRVPQGRPGSGDEFLSFHRYFDGKFQLWYDLPPSGWRPGAELDAVHPWDGVPGHLKSPQLGWSRTLADAENRIVNRRASFRSADELGIFIEGGIHGWLHSASSQYYNEPILATFHSVQSTYFYKLHGLIDKWWFWWENQSTPWGVGDHFYTTSAAERDSAVANYGYHEEGIACYVFGSQVPGTTPLYRLTSPHAFSGDHFYTTSAAERDAAVSVHGYQDEGTACYVYNSQASNTTPFYRLWQIHNHDHFYTTSAAERDNAITEYLYVYEQIQCYVYPSPVSGSTPFYRLLRA
jgi:hypothetical protein